MILVTGGVGFIGGNFLHLLKRKTEETVICLDSLTYAANPEFVDELFGEDQNQFFLAEADIRNAQFMNMIMQLHQPEYVVHFAAESHVDNSIENPLIFAETNVMGTLNLLEASRHNKNLKKFIHVSTDEVFGSLQLNDGNAFRETTPYQPNSPYSASKAASDHFVRAYHKTYGLPTIITNCSNNYGPNQNGEKFIPTIIDRAKNGLKIPVYGDGKYVRDWLYVEDHCEALYTVMQNGAPGERYNIGGGVEVANIDLVKMILEHMQIDDDLIEYVKDRPGHDRRYAIDCGKIERELGYKPKYDLHTGLKKTIEWYLKD